MLRVEPSHLSIVVSIINKHIPERRVVAFGSRVNGTPKTYSDLDICIMGDDPVPPSTLQSIRFDFEDSDIPYRVDVLDWNSISQEFRTIILKQYEIIHDGSTDLK